jgi:hypothetical protein
MPSYIGRPAAGWPSVLEGDFGFSAPNATAPAPEVGHEVKLINFNQVPGSPLALRFQNFGRNSKNLPNVAMWLVHPVTRGRLRPPLFQRAGDALDAPRLVPRAKGPSRATSGGYLAK